MAETPEAESLASQKMLNRFSRFEHHGYRMIQESAEIAAVRPSVPSKKPGVSKPDGLAGNGPIS